MGDFSSAWEADEIVIGGMIGIRVSNGNLEIKKLTPNSGNDYTVEGDAVIPAISFNELKREGFNFLSFDSGLVIASTASANDGSFRVEQWKPNNSKSYVCRVPQDYKAGTKMYPVIVWRTLTANPNVTQKVQFDIVYRVVSKDDRSQEYTVSVTDYPLTQYQRVLIVTDLQSIPESLLGVGNILNVVITRVRPVVGSDYSGVVIVDYLGVIYTSDVIMTNQKESPFTKANT